MKISSFAFQATLGTLFCLSTPSYSDDCGLTQTASINITVNGSEADPVSIRAKIDSRVHEIEEMAKSLNMDKFTLQSMNYNINPGNYTNGFERRAWINQAAPGSDNAGGAYLYNGNMNFSVLPADKGVDLIAALNKKGYHASISVNQYRNGAMNCDDSAAATKAKPQQE